MINSRYYTQKDAVNFIYTLGRPSVEVDNILVLKTLISNNDKFRDYCIDAKNLSEFKVATKFDFMSKKQLSETFIVNQPTKLKVGSKLKFENKYFEVGGLFIYSYAQMDFVSAMLLNPNQIEQVLKAKYYKGISDEQILEEMNNHFQEGKFDADFLFRFLDANNPEEKVSGVISPPIFDPAIFKPSEIQGSAGLPMNDVIPMSDKLKVIDENGDLEIITNTDFKERNFFLELPELRRPPSYKQVGDELLVPLYFGIDINYIELSSNLINAHQRRKIYRDANLSGFPYLSHQLSVVNFILSSPVKFKASKINDFLSRHDSLQRDFLNLRAVSSNLYFVKEGTDLGVVKFSSKDHLKGFLKKKDYDKMLDFGDLIFYRKNYYAVLKYFINPKDNKQYCLAINIPTQSEFEGSYPFNSDNKTDFYKNYKIYEANSVFRNRVIEDDKTVNLCSNFESKFLFNDKGLSVKERFLNQRQDQLEKLKKNNPFISEAITNLLSVIDSKVGNQKEEEKDKFFIKVSSRNYIVTQSLNDTESPLRWSLIDMYSNDNFEGFKKLCGDDLFNKEVVKLAIKSLFFFVPDDTIIQVDSYEKVHLLMYYYLVIFASDESDGGIDLQFNVYSDSTFINEFKFSARNGSGKISVMHNEFLIYLQGDSINNQELAKVLMFFQFEGKFLINSVLEKYVYSGTNQPSNNQTFLSKLNTNFNLLSSKIKLQRIKISFDGYDTNIAGTLRDQISEGLTDDEIIENIYSTRVIYEPEEDGFSIMYFIAFLISIYDKLGDTENPKRLSKLSDDKPMILQPKPKPKPKPKPAPKPEPEDDDDFDFDDLVNEGLSAEMEGIDDDIDGGLDDL